MLSAGDLEMDLVARSVRRGAEEIVLQPGEFRLLEFLLRSEGRLITRKMLPEQVWEFHFDPKTNIVETHISRLRMKIDRGRQFLVAGHGKGLSALPSRRGSSCPGPDSD